MAGLARRIWFPLRFAARRTVAARRPLAVAAFGVALASCALMVAFAASAIVENRAVADAIDELPASERNVEVTWVGLTSLRSESADALDRRARSAFASAGLEPVTSTLVYRDMRLAGQLVRIAAADGLARWFVVRSGRLPRACTPGHCETVVVGSGPQPRIPGFPVVGVVAPRAEAPVRTRLGAPAAGARSLVAEGVAAVAGLPQLASAFHSYTWSAPLASAHPTAWTLPELESKLTRARTSLQAASFRLDLRAPDAPLDDVARDAHVAYRRLLLVGGECAVLFLVFAIVAAASLRAGALAASQRLRRFGARRWQADLLTGSEAALIVLPATLLGWAAGALVAAALAAATDTPVSALLERTVLSTTGLWLAAVLAALAVLILFAVMRAQPIPIRGRRFTVVDAAAGGALLAVSVALAAGETDAERLASDRGTGVVLLLVPGLLIVAGALLAVRLTEPAFRLAERLAPRRRPALRLALLSAARNPGTQLVTVAFLVVSVGLAAFAATYRSTLLEGERDQAAFEVPLDYAVRRASTARRTSERTVGSAYAERNAVPVIRRTAEARSLSLATTVDVLGIPSDALPRLHWRKDFAEAAPQELSRQITPPGAVRTSGPRLPLDAETLTIPVAVRGDSLAVAANVRTAQGAYLVLDLGEAEQGGAPLRARVPAAARGGTIVALTLDTPPAEAFGRAHAAAEGGAPDVFSVGTLALGQPRVATPGGSKPISVDYGRWVTGDGSPPAASGARATLRARYLLTQERVFRLRPRQATDGAPVPVIACNSLADRVGPDGVVPLSIGPAVVTARVVARASLFPSLRCPFVVADVDALDTAVNAAAPGAAVADEAWIAGPPGLSQQLERAASPIPVAVTSRRAVEADLRDDPLAQGTVLVLAAGSLLALVLAVVALLLVVSVELRDDAGDFLDLETQGMEPAALRRQLLLRIGSLGVFGVVCGLVVGAVITVVITDLVAVAAGQGTPLPPLQLSVSWPEVAIGVLAFGLALGVALAVATRRAFADAR